MNNFSKILLLCVIFFLNSAHAAHTCTVSTTAINFGNYNPLSAANNDTTGTISVRCILTSGSRGNVSYVISLSRGNSSNYMQRYMMSGSNQLLYNIYTVANYSAIWGDGTQSSGTISNSYTLRWQGPTQRTDNFTAYARAPGSQNLPTGVYNDTITVTVTY